MSIKILGIDTSCDDIGISLIDTKIGIIFNKIYNQKIHNKYGGVVPKIASSYHLKKIYLIIKKLIYKYNIKINELNGIACTYGPGLFGSLLIGVCVSRSISFFSKIPYYPINHIEAHLLSPLINIYKFKIDKNIFPCIGLVISGGTTKLIIIYEIGNYKIIGKTLDDSIGEAIDKVARYLKLNYPGGPEIEKLSKKGKKDKYIFPRPLINKKNFNFSFSGLKTFILNKIKKKKDILFQDKCNISLELLESISDILIKKTYYATKEYNIKTILISGGVISNMYIKKKIRNFFSKINIKTIFPKKNMCIDNGAMIAYSCIINILNNKNYSDYKKLDIEINPNLSI